MAFDFRDLDSTTRDYMLRELQIDLDNDALYYGTVLSPQGKTAYPQLLGQALESGTPESLQADLSQPGLLLTHTPSATGPRKVASNAAQRLAGGEFNRLYVRAIAARAIDESQATVTVYRARESASARSSSEAQIGQQIEAAELLAWLRSNTLTPGAVDIPDVNSGLSVHL